MKLENDFVQGNFLIFYFHGCDQVFAFILPDKSFIITCCFCDVCLFVLVVTETYRRGVSLQYALWYYDGLTQLLSNTYSMLMHDISSPRVTRLHVYSTIPTEHFCCFWFGLREQAGLLLWSVLIGCTWWGVLIGWTWCLFAKPCCCVCMSFCTQMLMTFLYYRN